MKKIILVSILLLVTVLSACSTQATEEMPALVGTTAPDFTLDDALGGQTSLSDYQGRPVLLFFHMAVG
jgi:cytochrome oxidase Cu insertion factor (SCO1/SenC/PrrC family)